MNIVIRHAAPGDEAAWRRLWAHYLAFYGKTLSEAVTSLTWQRILDPSKPVLGRIAEGEDGGVLGFAVCVLHEGTWTMTPTCYLEDLFVDEAARGQGVGRALIEDVMALAKDSGWASVYWVTNADNAGARALYDQFGPADDYVRYRFPVQP
jgi:GNAT superfamily N-acetyltransferase